MTPKCPDCKRDQDECVCLAPDEMQQIIEHQAAQIEMLRKALENIKWHREPGGSPSKYAYEVEIMADKALSTTPDQALEQFAAKVKEQCAQVCESMSGSDYSPKQCASAIRAITELPK